MNLNEHQGKKILDRLGFSIPDSVVVRLTDPEAKSRDWDCEELVIKAQLAAGRRGKAGGIIVTTPASQTIGVQQLLGQSLVIDSILTKIPAVLVEGRAPIEGELFAALVLDQKRRGTILLLSQLGGMGVEGDAGAVSVVGTQKRGRPEIKQIGRRMKDWDLGCSLKCQVTRLALTVFRLFFAVGALVLEINPLALSEGRLLVIDAKLSLEECPAPRLTKSKVLRHQASYVPINAEGIGCVVNGAGLAMMTVDTIAERGGKALNFLDLGGKASVRDVRQAWEDIGKNSVVAGTLVNILGGIVSCAVIVRGMLNISRRGAKQFRTAVRLEGTEDWIGRNLLISSDAQVLSPVVSFSSAVRKAVSQVANANQ